MVIKTVEGTVRVEGAAADPLLYIVFVEAGSVTVCAKPLSLEQTEENKVSVEPGPGPVA